MNWFLDFIQFCAFRNESTESQSWRGPVDAICTESEQSRVTQSRSLGLALHITSAAGGIPGCPIGSKTFASPSCQRLGSFTCAPKMLNEKALGKNVKIVTSRRRGTSSAASFPEFPGVRHGARFSELNWCFECSAACSQHHD